MCRCDRKSGSGIYLQGRRQEEARLQRTTAGLGWNCSPTAATEITHVLSHCALLTNNTETDDGCADPARPAAVVAAVLLPRRLDEERAGARAPLRVNPGGTLDSIAQPGQLYRPRLAGGQYLVRIIQYKVSLTQTIIWTITEREGKLIKICLSITQFYI